MVLMHRFYIFLEMTTTSSLVAQMYETAGMSHFAHAKLHSVLVAQRSSPGDISVSGETITDLSYEFEDSAYKWNLNRNLKAREPFLSTGNYYEDSFGTLKAVVKKVLNQAYSSLHRLAIDNESIQKAHKLGIEAAYPALFAMDYE